ncbi:hypothetical protein Cabys_3755 [Caldithrix abyssi DSM 13497]|uniref:Uncharacterized protein n=1 Tax=Caldithrix abyssi DSM 13497 TaxID=880073 RepID=A0A1J1CDN3_CALAY|nr:hypothetical protein Cabys_3755 [Caldithrix abyssi DSM 13497]
MLFLQDERLKIKDERRKKDKRQKTKELIFLVCMVLLLLFCTVVGIGNLRWGAQKINKNRSFMD